MSPAVKTWLFRVLGAVTGVGVTAIAGVKADTTHFGMWFPLVAIAQTFIIAGLGNVIKKWES